MCFLRTLLLSLALLLCPRLSAQEVDCGILLVSFSEARVVNLPSLLSDLLTGQVLRIGDKHYAIPNVNHVADRRVGGLARLAWKQALAAARAAGPDAESLCRKTMSDLLLAHFTRAEGFTETYEIQVPARRTTKFVLPDGTVVYLGTSASIAAMRTILSGLR